MIATTWPLLLAVCLLLLLRLLLLYSWRLLQLRMLVGRGGLVHPHLLLAKGWLSMLLMKVLLLQALHILGLAAAAGWPAMLVLQLQAIPARLLW